MSLDRYRPEVPPRAMGCQQRKNERKGARRCSASASEGREGAVQAAHAADLRRRIRSVQPFPSGQDRCRDGKPTGAAQMPDDDHNPALALALILTATLFIAGTTLIAKLLASGQIGPALHPLQISQGRFVFGFATILSLAFLLRPRFTRPRWAIHVGRTAAGWAGVTLMFAAVGFIPLADATAISFLNPVFAMILAIPLLGERVGPVRWAAAGIALTGALILLRPSPANFEPAALLALAAALTLGLEVTVIKFLAGARGLGSDPADQQRLRRSHRVGRVTCGVAGAHAGRVAGTGPSGCADGLCAGLLHQRAALRRCEFRRAADLCDPRFRRPV